jgi:mono/diheme cytochrome c family protein
MRFALQTIRLTMAACPLILVLTAASAQTRPADTTLIANPVFQANCAKCHGKTAEGRHFAGPSLISDKVVTTSTDDLHTIITNGKGRMPKFATKLTSEEIDGLVEQIKSVGQKK